MHFFYSFSFPLPYLLLFPLFFLLNINVLVFSVFNSNFLLFVNLLNVSIISWIATLFFANYTISFAYANIQILLFPISIPPIFLSLKNLSIFAIYKSNRSGFITHPCLTPFLVQNFFVNPSGIFTTTFFHISSSLFLLDALLLFLSMTLS